VFSGEKLATIYFWRAVGWNKIDGRNYLVPVDVRLQAGDNPIKTMIDMDTILAGLDDQVRTNILILDACRNNPMAQKTATTGMHLEPRWRSEAEGWTRGSTLE
jgi:uncharacterized caspase-like protein